MREDLLEKTLKFRRLLEKYCKEDLDVLEAYEQTQELLDRIDSGVVIKPMKFPYGWIYFRGGNNLLAYADLCAAAADFANALESS